MKKFGKISEFSRNIFILISGTTIAQAIPVIISPILTKIYSPEDFGILTLYMSINSIIAVASTGRYQLAIMLPKENRDAFHIVILSMIASLFTGLIILLVILLFKNPIVNLLGSSKISQWLYFIPLSIFSAGAFNAFNYYNSRLKNYKTIAHVTIYKSFFLIIIQLLLGITNLNSIGLISGLIFSNLMANIIFLIRNIKNKEFSWTISISKVKYLAIKYIKFPKYSMPGIFINNLSNNLISILISSFHGIALLGHYSLAHRALDLPSSLIGRAINQVFFQQAVQEKETSGKAIKTFLSTLKKLLIIAIPSFTLFFFIVEDVFVFVFGENWKIAGTYAHILVPFICIKFIVIPVMVVDTIFEKQKIYLFSQILYLFIVLFSFFFFREFTLEDILYIFVSLAVILYGGYLYLAYLFAKKSL